jgi:hypothetical protein
MKARSVLFILFLIAMVFFLSFNFGYSIWWSSPGLYFNATPDGLYLNWSNSIAYQANLTLTANHTHTINITLEMLNSTGFSTNYSQPYGSGDLTVCQPIALIAQNSSGYGIIAGPLNGSATYYQTNVSLSGNHTECRPGRYYVSLMIRNYTNSTENLNVTIFLDIPISVSNNRGDVIAPNLLTTGVGKFEGSLPVNATTYHSYYFNTSEIVNATGVSMNLTGWSSSQDTDIFLFDNSENLKAKSINKNTTEFLSYNYLPSAPAMWEIRIYGNSTSTIPYTGYLMFTRLNVTNTSDQNQSISSIDFGAMNASTTNQVNLTLKNEGNFTLSNVLESKELYYIRSFTGSGNQNFTFLVPDSSIATKVKVALNWTGTSNYSLNLYNANGTLLANSTNKYDYANKTNSMQEEYNETSDIIEATYWKVEVKNNIVPTDTYTVTTFVYVNAANWLTSNFTSSGFTFNAIGQTNSAYTVNISLTVPNATLDGIYEGSLRYTDNRSAEIKIPIRINVTTPMLVVTNDATTPVTFAVLNSGTFRIDENYGRDLTRTFNFKLNNTGFYDLVVNLTNSSTLTCTSTGCSGYTANLTHNITNIGIVNNSYQVLEVNVSFNSSIPTGIYDGWIFINATNQTDSINLSSHPYQSFTLYLKLNLTDKLYTNVSETVSADGTNVVKNITHGENVTIKLNVYYINKTTGIIDLNTSNFTMVWLQEKNVSGATGRIPTTGSLSIFNGTNPIYGTKYSINVTVPANQPGGQYEVHVIANYTSASKNFDGEGINSTTLIINNTGLNITPVDSTSLTAITAGPSTSFNVSVKNFGPLAATSSQIQFYDGGCPYVTISPDPTYPEGGAACSIISGSGDTFTFSMAAYNSSGCWFRWKVYGDANGTCSAANGYPLYVKGISGSWFNNVTGISITVNPATTTTTLPTLPAPGATTEAPKYLDITSYPSLVLVIQGSTNSTNVTVKNINTTRGQDVKLTVKNINSTWFATTPALVASMLPLNSTNFTVLFSVPADAEVKDYSANFTAISNYANISKTFTLRVLPSVETKTEINATLASFKQNMTELWGEINQSAASGVNVTIANSTFLQLKALIDQAQTHINNGDYNSALYLFGNIRTLFNTTRTQLNQALQEHEAKTWFKWPTIKLPTGMLLYVLIFGGIAAAVILAYLFWPVKTEKQKPTVEPLYVPKEEKKEEDIIAMLKEKWGKLSKQKK